MLIYSKIEFHMLKGVKIGIYVTCMSCFCVSDLLNLKNIISEQQWNADRLI